jgi:hypothetical protein
MGKKFLLLFLLFFGCSTIFAAQQKYGLLIGINRYYSLDSSLKIYELPQKEYGLFGCVNDALSFKELMVSRFGFKDYNITELYDSMATKKNILDEIDKLYAKCNPGDIAFIYYSGHGASIQTGVKDLNNPGGKENETVEMILPSDVFTTTKYSCIQTASLAKKFIPFVEEKNIILTAIFDCCFSFGTLKDNEGENRGLMFENPDYTMEISDVKSLSDYNKYENYSYIKSLKTLNKKESEKTINLLKSKDVAFSVFDSIKRSIEKDAINYGINETNEKFDEVPPSKIPGSNFLFIAATNDTQKAREIEEVNGLTHGAFTYSLMKVFKKYPANISATEAYNYIKNELTAFRTDFIQDPSIADAYLRSDKTLFGIPSDSVKPILTLKCTEILPKNIIILDKGSLAGLSTGNKLKNLKNPEITAEITEVEKAYSKAKLKTTASAKVNDLFKVSDWSNEITTLLNVYLPDDVCSSDQLATIYNKIILPLQNNPNFVPYEKSDVNCLKIYLKNNAKGLRFFDNNKQKTVDINYKTTEEIVQYINKNMKNKKFFIYIPLPENLKQTIQSFCEKNTEIFFVKNPEDADISFYCSSYKNPKKEVLFNDTILFSIKFDTEEAPLLPLVIACSDEIIGKNRNKKGHKFNAKQTYMVLSNEKNKESKLNSFSSVVNDWFEK